MNKVWDILIKKGDPQDYVILDGLGIPPDSYLENGSRHAVVFGGDLLPEKLTMQKFSGHYLVVEQELPF